MKYCTKKCKNYKAQKPTRAAGRYATGQKRCQFCEIFIQWDGLCCPCCKGRLRCGPRSREGKEKYLEQTIA